MTLTLNKGEISTKWVVTTYEMNPNTDGCTIDLFNVATNVSMSFGLPNDSSPFPERYQQYIIDTADYSGVTNGIYTYTIKDSNSIVVEKGLLRVIENNESPISDFVFIQGEETDDDYIQ